MRDRRPGGRGETFWSAGARRWTRFREGLRMPGRADLDGFIRVPRFDPATPAPFDPSRPRVTVVTPSFNQARFLEATILSVLNQGYPNLEYIVMDGGSTDGSVDIIRRYERRLSSWTSGRDAGQSDAINRGFERSTGPILAWLNSDDAYLPGTLDFAARFFAAHPKVDLIYGDTVLIDTGDRPLRTLREVPFSRGAMLHDAVNLSQPVSFWRREAFFDAGRLREDFHYCMDTDLWVRMLDAGKRFRHVRRLLGCYRVYPEAKSGDRPRVSAEIGRLRRELIGWELDRFPHSALRRMYDARRFALLLLQGDVSYGFRGLAGRWGSR